nr:hypothetical protein [Tanacetum cinerariifolium]
MDFLSPKGGGEGEALRRNNKARLTILQRLLLWCPLLEMGLFRVVQMVIRLRRSSYARAMIELWADVELKDTIMVAMPKRVGEGFYLCTIHVEYDWKPPRCSSCKIYSYVLDNYFKNSSSNVAKNLKNPRQAAKGVSVGPKEETYVV